MVAVEALGDGCTSLPAPSSARHEVASDAGRSEFRP